MFNPYQIRLLRSAITDFIDARKDELEYDWVKGVHDDAIESCKASIRDALDIDLQLKIMYREAVKHAGGQQ